MEPRDLQELVRIKIHSLRPKLLDLGRRNPLLSTKLSPRSNAHIRVVDELPEDIFYKLNNGQEMRFISLPEIEDDPKDEQTKQFLDALANARLTDQSYLSELEAIDRDADDYIDRSRAVDRALRDRVRSALHLPPRVNRSDLNITQHARNNGVSPSYELPNASDRAEDGRHDDDNIQTLLLPKDLERKLNHVTSKCRTWLQETGINVLHLAYGFLEWCDDNQTETSYAPLVLCSAQIEKRRTRNGSEFWISSTGEEPELNPVLIEKMRLDFGIELPPLQTGSVEAYFLAISEIAGKKKNWRVRRQIAVGVFPSARMAMYHDIDPDQSNFPKSEIITSLLGGSASEVSLPFAEEYDVDSPEIERAVPCLVLDADSSQFSTLVDAAAGKNIAVEGPPGTGKSQTIVNAIAAALAAGKKVLFVAEKLAALNVVRSRLEAVGLGEFLLTLQAERSTREQVIGSLRSRIEMPTSAAVKGYDDQIAEYKRLRDDLAGYINVITSELGDSGLTVYDVLGRSIATADELRGVPASVIENCDVTSNFLTRLGLTQLKELGAEVERALRDAGEASSHWSGTSLTNVDRFKVDEICEQALKAASLHREAAAKHSALEDCGVDPSASLELLTALLEALNGMSSLPQLTEEVLVGLLEGNLDHISKFLEGCDAYAKSDAELQAVIASERDDAALHKIKHISQLCDRASFETLDVEVLGVRVRGLRQKLDHIKRLPEAMEPLLAFRPEAGQWAFPYIRKAQQIIAAAGREALACRSSSASEPAALSILEGLWSEGVSLQALRAELKRTISLDDGPSIDRLVEARSELQEAGLFSPLYRRYRDAKRVARSISLSKKIDNREAIQNLGHLIDYQRRVAAFVQSPQAVTLFGIHFRGVDTNFEPFEHLITFYKDVESELVAPDNRTLRNFLREADLDELELLPPIPQEAPAGCAATLRQELAKTEKGLDSIAATLAELQRVLTVFRAPIHLSPSSLPALAERLETQIELERELDGDKGVEALFGHLFHGARTQTQDLKSACLWARAAKPVSVVLGGLVRRGRAAEAVGCVRLALDARERAREALMKLSQLSGLPSSHFEVGLNEGSIALFLEEAAADRSGLFIHSEAAARTDDARRAGLAGLIEHLSQTNTAEYLGAKFEALAVRKLARSTYAAFGNKLSLYPGRRLDDLRKSLAAQDRKIIKLAREQLRWRVQSSAKPPRGSGVGRKSEWTEMALIEHEIGKHQRFISVRELTHRSSRALMELKPCWMMSPLAVAQYAPKGKIEFDLCIVDEASQMPPEEAIGALIRCKQTIIVGDTNQLPPSSFFKKMIDDEEDDEDENVLSESILEMANATFRPARRLRWHYRSRHSGLIKFSNRLIYDDDLIIFPSATESMVRMGVEYRSISGLYKAGTNAIEARAIVDAILKFMRTDPDRSLGVVTLNQKQRDLISEEFEHAVVQDRDAQDYIERWSEKRDGLEDFFIKNLENVQGDERDVIFIGTVYGPEVDGGRVAQRFGPINGLAGRRRLNVLFSRAKEKIITFSSMKAADILADEKGNSGAHMLKCWLEYCASGFIDGGRTTSRQPDSEFEEFVIKQIQAMGYEAVPQVGVAGYFIDIGVRHPSWAHGFVLGVECDGASYHSSKSARDRDRLRQEILEGLGWRFHRIWSTDWFNNPADEAARLRGVLSSRMEELKSKERDFTSRDTAPGANDIRVAPMPTEAQMPLIFVQEQEGVLSPVRDNVAGVKVGDTVRVRYLDGDRRVLNLTISNAESDLDNGVIHYQAPIAKALLGAEEGDEVEVLTGAYVRSAVIEFISKSLN